MRFSNMFSVVFVVVIASTFGCGKVGDAIEKKPIQGEVRKKELQWVCYDRIKYIFGDGSRFRPKPPVILKLKQFSDSSGSFSVTTRGIVEIIDGTRQPALFSFKGINRTWVFGKNYDHQIVLKPNQEAYYYDFTGAKDGERRKSRQGFHCEKL